MKIRLAGREAYAAAEDAARLRDGLGVVSPAWFAHSVLGTGTGPIGRSHHAVCKKPRTVLARSVAEHYGLGLGVVQEVLKRLGALDRVIQGEFLPEGTEKEWCEAQVLRRIKRASLEKREPMFSRSNRRLLPVFS